MTDVLPSTEEVLEATQSETSEAQPQGEQSEGNSPKATSSVSENTVLEMDVAGEKKQVSVKDLREGFMRNQDYTQKTQGLAEQRRELEQIAGQMQQREQAFTEMLKDPQKVLSLAASQQPSAQDQAPALSDGDVPTVGAIKKMFLQERQQTQQASNQVQQQMQQQQIVTQMEQAAKQAFEKVYDAIPDLKEVPFIEDTLKKMALDSKPDSLEKMQDALIKAGSSLSKTYGFKQKAGSKATPSSKLNDGIEPPGGSAMPPPPDKTYGQGKTIDWSELDKDAIAWMESGGKS